MTYDEASKLSFTELRAILLTVDGKGKSTKEIALEELLSRKYDEGYNCGAGDERYGGGPGADR